MIDPTIITKLAAAGAMGVSIFCVLKVYELLKNEQDKENPRPHFIRSIYVSMGFAVVMTLLSLGIELVRNTMDDGMSDLTKQLAAIQAKGYYVVDNDLHSEAVSLIHGDDTFHLAQPIPHTLFVDNELKMSSQGSNCQIYKKHNGDSLILGFIPQNKLIMEQEVSHVNPQDLYEFGLWYTPEDILNRFNVDGVEKDMYKSIPYLLAFLCEETDVNMKREKNEVAKILADPNVITLFEQQDYDQLIEALEQHNVRSNPYYLYDLAQVYKQRSKQADTQKYTECLTRFVERCKLYKAFAEDQVEAKDSVLYIQYQEAMEILARGE